jgi:hypothetical protein
MLRLRVCIIYTYQVPIGTNWDMGKRFQTSQLNRGTKNMKRNGVAMYGKFRIPKNLNSHQKLHISQNLNVTNFREPR